MTVKTSSISLSTQGNADIQDITEQVARNILQSGLKDGTATVFCPSSTSALTTIEYESGAVSDLRRLGMSWSGSRSVNWIKSCGSRVRLHA